MGLLELVREGNLSKLKKALNTGEESVTEEILLVALNEKATPSIISALIKAAISGTVTTKCLLVALQPNNSSISKKILEDLNQRNIYITLDCLCAAIRANDESLFLLILESNARIEPKMNVGRRERFRAVQTIFAEKIQELHEQEPQVYAELVQLLEGQSYGIKHLIASVGFVVGESELASAHVIEEPGLKTVRSEGKATDVHQLLQMKYEEFKADRAKQLADLVPLEQARLKQVEITEATMAKFYQQHEEFEQRAAEDHRKFEEALLRKQCLQEANNTVQKVLKYVGLDEVADYHGVGSNEDRILVIARAFKALNDTGHFKKAWAKETVNAVIQSANPEAMANLRIQLAYFVLNTETSKDAFLTMLRSTPDNLDVLDFRGVHLRDSDLPEIVAAVPRGITLNFQGCVELDSRHRISTARANLSSVWDRLNLEEDVQVAIQKIEEREALGVAAQEEAKIREEQRVQEKTQANQDKIRQILCEMGLNAQFEEVIANQPNDICLAMEMLKKSGFLELEDSLAIVKSVMHEHGKPIDIGAGLCNLNDEVGLNTQEARRAIIQSIYPRVAANFRIAVGRLLSNPSDKKALDYVLFIVRDFPDDLKAIDLRGINLHLLDGTMQQSIIHAISSNIEVLRDVSQDGENEVMIDAQHVANHKETQRASGVSLQKRKYCVEGNELSKLHKKRLRESSELPISQPQHAHSNRGLIEQTLNKSYTIIHNSNELTGKQDFLDALTIASPLILQNFDKKKNGFDFNACLVIAREVNVLSSKAAEQTLTHEDVQRFEQIAKPYTTCSRMKAALVALVGAALGLLAGFAIAGIPGAAIGVALGLGLFGGGYAYQHQKRHAITQISEAIKPMIVTC